MYEMCMGLTITLTLKTDRSEQVSNLTGTSPTYEMHKVLTITFTCQ